MLLSILGDIVFGTFGINDYMTGPTADKLTYKNTWARHDVIRGKPVLQEIGQELDERTFDFYFDEVFCNPTVQWSRLWTAYLIKTPLPFITQTGFNGLRYVVEELDKSNLKTTKRGGSVVRMECTMTLIEAPLINPLDAVMNQIRSGIGLQSAENNPQAKK